ncbi:MAG: glucose-6-phosphate dehydrogenase [Anaerolineales bacterium]
MADDTLTTIVIFGASGDLTQRKLIPSLYSLYRKGRMPERFRIVGHSKTPFTDERFRARLAEGVKEFASSLYSRGDWHSFAGNVRYHQGHYDVRKDFESLDAFLREAEGEGGGCNRLYYMATPPGMFAGIVDQLGETNQLDERTGWRRVVIEKPFGVDLASAQQLNGQIHEHLHERQVYRIDHYLGKETVQNILVTRFANTIFEPLWNRNYIDHVQITVAEAVGVEHRAGYYDNVGVLRDMFQNHLMQLVALVAMEPPASFNADALRNEKVKVLSSIQPFSQRDYVENSVRAQYRGYLEESGVKPASRTATFAALRVEIDNWRWQGVPFYLRSGKCLKEKLSTIAIEFKRPPHMLFPSSAGGMSPNILMLFLQPDEGIHWRFEAKVPDTVADTQDVDMEFHYAESFPNVTIPEAYERLLLEALAGDASLFTRADEVEAAWGLIDPLAQAWASGQLPTLGVYEPGTWGTAEADALLARDGRRWIEAPSS